MPISTTDIRLKFLDFFRKNGHQDVASSSLVPTQDPTLLFTNAGMNQFKDVFLGLESRSYTRAVSSQRCLRAGGKHNDLENVGYTARHHTFFEMLGNFSFGDYFKREAINYAWQFLTQELRLPADKLFVTVFEEDDEARAIWLDEIGLPVERLACIGAKDNFWQMGDTGPCGPCSEIFYDHGPEVFGGPPGSLNEDGDRFIEIWNLVFMQYNRLADGTLEELPRKAVDTGMGLERLAAVLQKVHSNYEIDMFAHLIQAAARITGASDMESKSLRVIADHIRACAFLLADGVTPSNEGRGYVLRRIIRRAVRHGRKLGGHQTFFYKMLVPLIETMGETYPELVTHQVMIQRFLRQEEEQFSQTLERGLSLLDDEIKQLGNRTHLPGDIVFKLYDTYGFPADLTADILRDRNLSIDQRGFDQCMQAQRQRGKKASTFAIDYNQAIQTQQMTLFDGYQHMQTTTRVEAIYKDGQSVDVCQAGQQAAVILHTTPFYPESGGQVGDQGEITFAGGVFDVIDTQKKQNAIFHQGYVRTGELRCGASVTASIDAQRRQDAALNHSATHLLHAALRNILGVHVQQKGSLVTPSRLRFDFVHPQALSAQELADVEQQVNAQIRQNHRVTTQNMSLQAAKASGALALFSEKYEDQVRVVRMGDYSCELCGGTHVEQTGNIGLFHILSESGIAAGIRRIEACSGHQALLIVQSALAQTQALASTLKVDSNDIQTRVTQLQKNYRHLEREYEQLQSQLNMHKNAELANGQIKIKGQTVVVAQLPQSDAKSLRSALDMLKNKLQSAIIVLGSVSGDKVSLIAGVTQDLTSRVQAGELVNMVAKQVGGKGGGRPDMAQAGGSEPEKLPQALDSVSTWLDERL